MIPWLMNDRNCASNGVKQPMKNNVFSSLGRELTKSSHNSHLGIQYEKGVMVALVLELFIFGSEDKNSLDSHIDSIF